MPNPISRTAYYTLAVRAADAARPKPILGDTFAQRFMNDSANGVWQEFKSFAPANGSNAARHAMIDEHLRRAIAGDSQATIVIIGAGFDTRAFRLRGASWFEFDEPEILTYKESRLPVGEAPNPLRRIPIEFAREKLADKLTLITPPSSVHVVIEGVLMYLTHAQRLSLLQTVADRFPHHTVYCDLMRKNFFEKYSRDVHEKIVGMGTTFTDMEEAPERLFNENGYTTVAIDSVPLYAVEHANIGIPAFAVRYFMRTLREGYVIAVFRR
ncbi:MAG TPA: SAM-dependent methyltransferase [Vicinamibacterales bacterium]|nr:SAM-dependent methyltransferase [Vicinamibacterales bacterium]